MRRTVMVGLLLAVACGGGSADGVRARSGPTQFSGASAQFRRTDGSISGQPCQILGVGIFDVPPWCYRTDGGTGPTTIATVGIEIIRPGTEPVGTGTWSTSRPAGQILDGAVGHYQKLVNDQFEAWLDVVSGSVQLSRADDVAVEGELSLTLEDGTHLEGHFSATPQRSR